MHVYVYIQYIYKKYMCVYIDVCVYIYIYIYIYINSVQLLSHVLLLVTPWTAAPQASLPITNC